MTVGSLFAGIGGLDLGAERAGFDVIWQCEQDEYCTKVLNKHWPNTPVYNDVQTLYTDDGPHPRQPDILCGGFPCQDISLSGKGAGLNGKKSGLWWEFARCICLVRPRYAILENVAALVDRGLKAILGWFAENGYDAEWQTISASSFGAPHQRERLFIVAHSNRIRRRNSSQRHDSVRLFERRATEAAWMSKLPESAICGKDDGLSRRVDRTKALGNAVVPQVAEFVFNCVKEHRRSSR